MKKCLIFLKYSSGDIYIANIPQLWIWYFSVGRRSIFLVPAHTYLQPATTSLGKHWPCFWGAFGKKQQAAADQQKTFWRYFTIVTGRCCHIFEWDYILICTASVWTGCWQPIFGLWSSNDGLNQLFYFTKNIQTSCSETDGADLKKELSQYFELYIYLRTFKVILCLSPSFPCTQLTLP